MRIGGAITLVSSIACLWFALPPANAAADPAFQAAVEPIFHTVCSGCHNQKLASGGLNIEPFLDPKSLTESRDGWDIILRKLRAGEMPPAGIPKPAKLDALIGYVQGRLDDIDKNAKPDPGRVVAHRLNRYEYSNTVRDLLAVDYQGDKSFPTDDSGYGFDNIGSVLTVSPLLMSRYMNAAQKIASRAMGIDPLPKPIEAEYSGRNKNVTKPERGALEARVRIDFDGDYTIRFGLPGERAADAKPVDMALFVDGKVVQTISVETKPSKLVYFDPYSEEKMTVHFTEGEHTVRAAFLNDDFAAALSPKDAGDRKKNKFIDSMTFVGPFAPAAESASRKKILICDPKTGAACVQKIVANLATHAYRRPAAAQEVAALVHFVDFARTQGQSVEQGIQLAIQAILVSPNFLFKIENGTTAPHPVSDYELASRLSYFLWSSMPDDQLMALAAQGKLHTPAVLDDQVKRMLADAHASALASNFAGQWLETRNLDVVKPDPQKFPEWNADLREAMKAETRMFFEYVLRENRPITDFLDARYTFLNDKLARFYGIPDVKGPEFRRVDLTTDQRGGVLGQAAVLTVSSYPTRTSVVLRGKFILDNILGSPVPPPPPDVPALDDATVGKTASLRQQMEKHRADPACATCHNKMDPLGFGLENYDAIGKWRTKDGNFPVDSTGSLPSGKAFATPSEMRNVLTTGLQEFSHCLTQKMLTYALERGLQPYDRRTEAEINRQLAAANYSFQTLIYGIVHSLPFQQSRGEAPAPPSTAAAKTNLKESPK
jgi:mono/diheme cytochrome c family protein